MSDQASYDSVVILCTPRCCSTVVCAMLGQHPQLYGFPELNLFVADDLGELWRLGKSPLPDAESYLTGLLRVVAQLEFGGQTDDTMRLAQEWLSARQHWTTRQMLDQLSDWIYPRLGVDKSPRTGLSIRAIERALSSCPRSRFIHLTRHPVATLRSLRESHRRVAPGSVACEDEVWLSNFYARLWVQSQELIISTVDELGASRATRARAEDLLSEPDIHLARLARWLRVSSDSPAIEAMKHPEHSPYAQPAPLGMEGDGDPHFMRSPRLAPLTAPESQRVPTEWGLEPSLAAKVNDLSHRLSYGPIL